MSLSLLVGGMPRGGTTVAAKFLSLHPDTFCYAGESHLIPLMKGMFSDMPCRPDRIDAVIAFLRQQFMTSMVEMPRFSVSQGAHPGNLIFDESSVERLLGAVRTNLRARLFGQDLYKASLSSLNDLLTHADPRRMLGEKTPSNIFAMADYVGSTSTKNVIVMREPVGVLRSMLARVSGGDIYSSAFRGRLEAQIGLYVEYASAAHRILQNDKDALLVRYEDLAEQPDNVIRSMFDLLGGQPEQRILDFVDKGGDPEIANRAPMNYRRLRISSDSSSLSPGDMWKVFSLTRPLRSLFGYSDIEMTALGFKIPTSWPDAEVPTAIIPFYGFYSSVEGDACNAMKRRAAVLVYVEKVKKHDVVLTLNSKFPDMLPNDSVLDISLNGAHRERVDVSPGSQSTKVKVPLNQDDFVPMGNRGGYAVLQFLSSVSYCALGHYASGSDARETSFRLGWWTIKTKLGRKKSPNTLA